MAARAPRLPAAVRIRLALVGSTDSEADLKISFSLHQRLPSEGSDDGVDSHADDYSRRPHGSQPTFSHSVRLTGSGRLTVDRPTAPLFASRLLATDVRSMPEASLKRPAPPEYVARWSIGKRPRVVEHESGHGRLRGLSTALDIDANVSTPYRPRPPSEMSEYDRPLYAPPLPNYSSAWRLERPLSLIAERELAKASPTGHPRSPMVRWETEERQPPYTDIVDDTTWQPSAGRLGVGDRCVRGVSVPSTRAPR
jgi:hypothetical protein